MGFVPSRCRRRHSELISSRRGDGRSCIVTFCGKKCVVEANESAVGFYERLGFVYVEDVNCDDGLPEKWKGLDDEATSEMTELFRSHCHVTAALEVRKMHFASRSRCCGNTRATKPCTFVITMQRYQALIPILGTLFDQSL